MNTKVRLILAAMFLLLASFWLISVGLHEAPLSLARVSGEFMATVAITMLALNLLLASRARWIERIAGGLDKMYSAHRLTGILAVVFLIAHVVMVPQSAAFSVGKPVGIVALVAMLLGVFLAVLPRTPLGRKIELPYHKWRLSHRALGVVFTIGAIHSLVVPSLISQMPIVWVYVHIVIAVAIGAWVYRSILFDFLNKPSAYTVSTTSSLSEKVIDVTLSPLGKGIDFIPGQFVFLSFDSQEFTEPHPFTINSHPRSSDLRFSIKALGDYTTRLQTELKSGAKAEVEGPYGCFDYRRGKPRQLWLAGGVGICPFLSFLQDVNETHEITLVWSVNEADEAFRHEEIEALTRGKPNVEYERHIVAKDGFLEISERHVRDDPNDYSVFICGPVAMRESFIEQLVTFGISHRDIHFEEFSFR
jgi:predicted ferric reductase